MCAQPKQKNQEGIIYGGQGREFGIGCETEEMRREWIQNL